MAKQLNMMNAIQFTERMVYRYLNLNPALSWLKSFVFHGDGTKWSHIACSLESIKCS